MKNASAVVSSHPRCFPDREALFNQTGELDQRDHVEAVRDGIGGVGVRLDEEPVGPGAERRLGERTGELMLTAALPAGGAGQLHAVRGVKNHRSAKPLHDRKAAHIDHEILVAKGGAALRLPDLRRLPLLQFADDKFHFLRGEKLPLLDVDRLARGGGREQQVGLPAQEGGNLQHVADSGDGRGLRPLVDVGQDGKPKIILHERKQFQSLLHAGAASALERGAVRLVERTLEDNVQLVVLTAELLQGFADGAADLLVFQRARSGDQEKTIGVVEHGGRNIGIWGLGSSRKISRSGRRRCCRQFNNGDGDVAAPSRSSFIRFMVMVKCSG